MVNFNPHDIKGIIFDYGGTLDSAGDHWSEIIWKGYQAAGVIVDKAEFRDAYVYGERELARTLHILPEHNFRDLLGIKIEIELGYLVRSGHMNPEEVAAKSGEVADYCYNYARGCIEKIRPVLDTLKSRYPMVLVSNFYGNISSVLADFGLGDYFKKIIESSVVGVRKPDPAIFQLGVEALGLRAEEVLVVGDSLRKDIEPAERLGCHALWLKGKGWTAEEDAAVHPNMIRKLGEILEFM